MYHLQMPDFHMRLTSRTYKSRRKRHVGHSVHSTVLENIIMAFESNNLVLFHTFRL